MEPSIQDAKALAAKLRKRGVVILTFTTNKVSGASYGATWRDCDVMRKVLNEFVDRITSGEVKVPFDLDDVEIAE